MHCYLHIREDGTLIPDPEGANYATLDLARADAVEGAGDILAARLRVGRPLGGLAIEICDERHQVLDIVRSLDVIRLA